MKTSKIHVIKFGGTSLKNERYIKQATKIVDKRNKEAQLAVVVSAIDGVTDSLINLAEHPGRFELIDKIEQRHFDLYHKLSANRNGEYISLKQLFDELRQVVQDEDLRSINFSAWKDHILSFGERAVAVIFSAVLSAHSVSSEPVMAFKIIKTNSRFNEARVDREQSRQLIRRKLARMSALPVITGFIGSDKNGAITTLGRSGSDYTAGLIAGALDAERLEIWTDVDGVLSADPRWVPGAKNISELSFADIEELSAHGANVIHPKTIKPVRNCSTSVIIKNSYNPSHAGTAIKRNFPSNGSLKTITLTGPFVQLKIDDKDTFRLLEELKSLSANWADTFSFKRSSSFEAARFLIDQPFFNLKEPQLLQWTEENDIHFEIKKELYKVKKFSNCFNDNEQLMSRIWNLLISRDLQPLQVERNSSDRFASFLFSKKEALRAARLFDTYLQNDKKIIDIFIAGNGAVGSTLLQQLRNLKAKDIEFRLLGICNSKKCLWNEKGINFEQKLNWSDTKPTDWEAIVESLTKPSRHNTIFVDATGNKQVARLYDKLLSSGAHIVTPSKRANTFEQSYFDKLETTAAENGTSFRYETTVGAGLPVISTINDLLKSGDEIFEVSGVVSGTMTYLFNQVEKGLSFSEAVIKARDFGYSEPDPRDDLSGEDVARKFLTIARTLGIKIEREELEVESLIPEALNGLNRPEFLNRLPDYDSYWENRFKEARKNNKKLQYVGSLTGGKITVGIEAVPINSAIGQLKGTDNIIQIRSRFYNQTPLLVQGPGAGKQVTAAGVMSDILKTAEKLV